MPPELVARFHVTVVPMWLTLGEESIHEGERPLSEILGDARVVHVRSDPR